MNEKLQQEYDRDFYAWALHNASLIRSGKFSEVDLEHVAEEIESMGRSDKREIASRLAVLIAHLLKWGFQPSLRSKSWKYTIKEQRIKISKLLQESPSLNHEIELKIEEAYEEAIVLAIRDTGLEEDKFPKICPFNLEQCLNQDFFPE
jgi:hypothetical protein